MAPRRRDDRQPGLFGPPGEASAPVPAAPEAETIEASPRHRPPPDAGDRDFATDPRHHVVLEASAGTGKTSVLVQRYLNLLGAGVDPSHVLAMTFTRKAAAEMRQRIVGELRRGAALSDEGRRRWLRVRDRVGEIAISTIDAFCLSLLREFPLEAGLDPSFQVADGTEVARLVERTLDETLRVARARAGARPDLAYVLTQLTPRQLRDGLRHLLDRRAVALPALATFLARVNAPATAGAAVRRAVEDVLAAIEAAVGLRAWLAAGPATDAGFAALALEVSSVGAGNAEADVAWRRAFDRLRGYFLTQKGDARRQLPFAQRLFADRAAYERHRQALGRVAPGVAGIAATLDAQVNAVLARGILQLARIAEAVYLRAMEAAGVLDFTETLRRAVDLLRQMDEFSRSRFRLESRYHHVLVDEFQDTSRLQWELVSLLVEAWGAGEGLSSDALPPSVFLVGDRKQSIYRFRDAEVRLLDEAARHIAALRPSSRPTRTISTSFRSAPALLAFVNDVFADLPKSPGRRDAFRYEAGDRFPLLETPVAGDPPVLGLAAATTAAGVAEAVAAEVVRLIADGDTVRDRETGVRRPAGPGDVAILFRSRDSHREYERALDARGLATYVYKGLGFFEADEIQDLSALVRYLARPASPLREAALLRSRIVGLGDAALAALAGDLGRVLRGAAPPPALATLGEADRDVLAAARAGMASWLPLVDRWPPADVIDRILLDAAYAFELRGTRLEQARENVKKFRGLVRRIQNRGYATMERIAEHLDRLSVGDESNAAIDAVNSVHLMTVHASKGLEFPIVFVVNLAKGTGAGGGAVRVVAEDGRGEAAASIGTLRFEADEEEKLRDREETKRLLYVALTRARDRLYLASALTAAGRFRPMTGSLGEVLPPSCGQLLEAAARDEAGEIAWTASGGATHRFRRCARGAALLARAATGDGPRADRFAAIEARPAVRVESVRERVQPAPVHSGPARARDEVPAELVAGRLVHRLFQRVRVEEEAGLSDEVLAATTEALLGPEERDDLPDPAAAVADACRLWRTLARRGDAAGLFEGEVLHEVPFTLAVEPSPQAGTAEEGGQTVVRGVIDGLVLTPGGGVRVIEIKTGRRAAWHQEQLDLYVRAARALFPGAPVTGVLLVADGP